MILGFYYTQNDESKPPKTGLYLFIELGPNEPRSINGGTTLFWGVLTRHFECNKILISFLVEKTRSVIVCTMVQCVSVKKTRLKDFKSSACTKTSVLRGLKRDLKRN